LARLCADGGWVVSARYPVPDDPSWLNDPRGGPLVGCSALRCGDCGEHVRQQAGVAGTGDLRGRRVELYEAPDWSALPWIEDRADLRLYACRCTVWLSSGQHATDDPDPTVGYDPILPWRCSGHPVPELPVEAHGLRIDEATDWTQLVRGALKGKVPEGASAKHRGTSPSWLIALYLRLEGLDGAAQIAAAVAAHANSRGKTWGDVLSFFSALPMAHGFDRLLTRAEADGPSTAAKRVGFHSAFGSKVAATDALDARLRATPTRDALYDRSLAVVRSVLLAGAPKVDDLIRLSGALDSEWMATNVVEIERASPGRWRPVLETLKRQPGGEWVVIAGVALARAPDVVDSGALRSWIDLPENEPQAWALVIRTGLG